MLYSSGECPVCGRDSDVLFVKDSTSGHLFFLCPSCGCAWLKPPPRHELESVDPPSRFAPSGLGLPTLQEITDAGHQALIVREVKDEDWMDILTEFYKVTVHDHVVLRDNHGAGQSEHPEPDP